MVYYRSPCEYANDSYVEIYAWYFEDGDSHGFCGSISNTWVISSTRFAYVKFHTSSEPNNESLIGFSRAEFIAEGLFISILLKILLI